MKCEKLQVYRGSFHEVTHHSHFVFRVSLFLPTCRYFDENSKASYAVLIKSFHWLNVYCETYDAMTYIKGHFCMKSKQQPEIWDHSDTKKTSVCTGTHGGSETSLNTVVHENVKVYVNSFLKFP